MGASDLWALAVLALLDAANPSALAVTIFLILQGPGHPRRVLVYVAGIFAVYLSLGMLLWSGLALVLSAVGELWESTPGHVAQAVLGIGMAVYGFWPRPSEEGTGGRGGSGRLRREAPGGVATVFGLGMTVSLIESSTAAPYIAAVGIIGSAGPATLTGVAVLVAYNVIMIVPPVLLMVLATIAGDRLTSRLGRWAERFEKQARQAFFSVVGAVGVLLALNALRYFDTGLFSG